MRTIAVLFDKGGMGDVGKHVLVHALQQDALQIRAIGKAPEDVEATESVTKVQVKDVPGADRIELIKVDPASDLETLQQSFAGVEAVVSCIGNRQPGMERVAGPGMEKVVAAMKSAGVKRLVALSSVGLGKGSWPRLGAVKVMFSILFVVIRSAKRDLMEAESHITGSDLDYLIVRTVGLTPTYQPAGSWKILEGKEKIHFEIAKEDVAAFLLQEALQPARHHQAVTIGSEIKKK